MVILNSVVCYNNEEEIIEYAKKLEKQKCHEDIRLIITMNKSAWNITEFSEVLKRLSVQSFIYTPNENLGYLNGMLYGYREYLKNSSEDYQWAIFSNTDISYVTDSFFERLSTQEYEKDIWLLGPSAVDKTGTYLNPMRNARYSKKDIILRKKCFEHPTLSALLNLVHGLRKKSDNSKPDSQYCYMIHGCYMILNKELADTLVKNTPWELMYAEENYLAEITRSAVKKVYYDSELEIIHEAGTVTGTVNDKLKRNMHVKSLNRLLKEFY